MLLYESVITHPPAPFITSLVVETSYDFPLARPLLFIPFYLSPSMCLSVNLKWAWSLSLMHHTPGR